MILTPEERKALEYLEPPGTPGSWDVSLLHWVRLIDRALRELNDRLLHLESALTKLESMHR